MEESCLAISYVVSNMRWQHGVRVLKSLLAAGWIVTKENRLFSLHYGIKCEQSHPDHRSLFHVEFMFNLFVRSYACV
jgi:hypothetical protein